MRKSIGLFVFMAFVLVGGYYLIDRIPNLEYAQSGAAVPSRAVTLPVSRLSGAPGKDRCVTVTGKSVRLYRDWPSREQSLIVIARGEVLKRLGDGLEKRDDFYSVDVLGRGEVVHYIDANKAIPSGCAVKRVAIESKSASGKERE